LPTETDPFAHLSVRTPLYDGDRLVLVFGLEKDLYRGHPWADLAWRPPSVPPAVAADAALSALAGYALSTTDPALAEALAARGGTELRHAHVMTHALDPAPEVASPIGAEISQLTRDALDTDADELAIVNVAAYPPDHPDHEHTDPAAAARELRAFANGEILGPFLDLSTVARVDGRLAGACIVVDREGDPPDAGPWIVDVFRDSASAFKGLGAALIAAAIAAAREAGRTGIGLAVTHANTAAYNVYRRLGFADAGEGWTLALPKG
jgi:GNAT superfamily N-acetyltransferase